MYKQISWTRNYTIIVTDKDLEAMYEYYMHYSECAPTINTVAVYEAVDEWLESVHGDYEDELWVTMSMDEISEIEKILFEYIESMDEEG